MLGKSLVLTGLLLSSLPALAKDKNKAPLPADVLQAHKVWVEVDPNAGVDMQDPNANRIARLDVERALTKWGRFEPVTNAETADLVIVVRKGPGKTADNNMGDPSINQPPPPNGQSPGMGMPGQARPRTGGMADASSNGAATDTPFPQAGMGGSQDTFAVYRNHAAHTLDSAPVWQYTATDALHSPNVPAVEVFRKLIADSEKKLAKTPQS